MDKRTELKTFFDANHEKAEYVEMYEENSDFFNGLLLDGHLEDIEYVIPMKLNNYADSLYQLGKYKKALRVLVEVDKELEQIKDQSKDYDKYKQNLALLTGSVLARLKKYKASNAQFKILLKSDPTNDRYIGWYKSNTGKQIYRILDIISIFGAILYIGTSLFNHFVSNIQSEFLKVSGLIIILLSFLVSYIWHKKNNKSKLKI